MSRCVPGCGEECGECVESAGVCDPGLSMVSLCADVDAASGCDRDGVCRGVFGRVYEVRCFPVAVRGEVGDAVCAFGGFDECCECSAEWAGGWREK